MKSLVEFINVNINESHMKFEIEDVADAINSVCDGDEWALDPHASRTGTFAHAVDIIGNIYDVLEFHDVFRELADYLDCDEDELMDFISDNEDEIMKKMGF